MITALGGVFAVLSALALIKRPPYLAGLLALAAVFPHSAAVVAAGNSISCFHFIAAISAVRLLWLIRSPARLREAFAGLRRAPLFLLVIFMLDALVVTAIGPAVFAGLQVYASRGGIDQQAISTTPLGFTISNLAQGVYLVLNAAAMLYLAVERGRPRRIYEVTIAAGVIGGSLRAVLPTGLVNSVLDTMTNVSYPPYDDRLRGTFGEPSMFGLFLSAAAAYLVVALVRARGRRRILWLAVLTSLTVADIALNRSGTVLIALTATGVVGALVVIIIWARGGRPILRITTVAVVAVIVAVAAITPPGRDFIGLFAGKAATLSFSNRTRADSHALTLLAQTFGIGAGLGSNRPSSLLPMLLSCVGIVGTLALLGLLATLLAADHRRRLVDPSAWGLIGALAAYFASIPDLSLPTLWILCGMLLRVDSAGTALFPEGRRSPHVLVIQHPSPLSASRGAPASARRVARAQAQRRERPIGAD